MGKNNGEGFIDMLKKTKLKVEEAFDKEILTNVMLSSAFVKAGERKFYPFIKMIVLIMMIDNDVSKNPEIEDGKAYADELYDVLVNTLDKFAESSGIDLNCVGEGRIFDCNVCVASGKCIAEVMPKGLGLTVCPGWETKGK